MFDFYNFVNKNEKEVDLYITGDIVDNDMQWFYDFFEEDCTTPKKFRAELDKHAGKRINVEIDSNGGSVFAASSIYTALKNHKGEVICKVSGIAASAASVIAMAGDKVYMSPTAMLMIHNPLVNGVGGNQHELRHYADVLDGIKESIINAYERKTNLSREKISKLMDKESWFDVNEAIELGFVDGVWGEENVNKDALFNKSFLESIKNQKIAIYNAVKPQNKPVEPQEPTANTSEPINDNKPTESEIKAVQAKLKLLALKRKRF